MVCYWIIFGVAKWFNFVKTKTIQNLETWFQNQCVIIVINQT